MKSIFKAFICVLSGIILNTAQLSAQSISAKEVQQQFGITYRQHNIADEMILPGLPDAHALKFGYDLTSTSPKRKTSIAVGYEKIRYEGVGYHLNTHEFSIRLSDGFNITAGNRNIAAYMGYALKSTPSFTSGKNIYAWNSSLLACFYQSYEYKIKNHRFILSATIPLAGAVYRPKEKYNNDEKKLNNVLSTFYSNPGFASFHNYRDIGLSFAYKMNINKYLGLEVNYDFNYKKWTGTNPFEDKSHGLGLSLSFNMVHEK